MLNPNHTAFKAAKTATDRRLAAIAAYEAACEAPEFTDWRAIADMLRAVTPTPKAKADPSATWVDYPMPRSIKGKLQMPKPILFVRFADGRSARVTALTLAGKPVNWGRGVRQAIEFYRGRVVHYCGGPNGIYDHGQHIDVPEIESVTMIATGQTFDAAEANRMTAEIRAGSFNLQRTLQHAHMAGYATQRQMDDHVRCMYLWGTPGMRDADGACSPVRANADATEEAPEKPVERRSVIRDRFMHSTSIAAREDLDSFIAAVLAA